MNRIPLYLKPPSIIWVIIPIIIYILPQIFFMIVPALTRNIEEGTTMAKTILALYFFIPIISIVLLVISVLFKSRCINYKSYKHCIILMICRIVLYVFLYIMDIIIAMVLLQYIWGEIF